MRIQDVIRTKGSSQVTTIAPTATVGELVTLLHGLNIGAAVVSTDGLHIEGIVSERDIVHGLARHGAAVVDAHVSDIMTSDVKTADPETSLEDLASAMTTRRIRHMPVVVETQLVGLVSIGDVVKHRMAQLADERDQLVTYLHSNSN